MEIMEEYPKALKFSKLTLPQAQGLLQLIKEDFTLKSLLLKTSLKANKSFKSLEMSTTSTKQMQRDARGKIF